MAVSLSACSISAKTGILAWCSFHATFSKSFLKHRKRPKISPSCVNASSSSTSSVVLIKNDQERRLVDGLLGIRGRGRFVSPQKLKEVEKSIAALELDGGIPDPTSSPEIEGQWRLIFTTRPGTASPIQRTFVGLDSFLVFQDIQLRNTNDPRVSNIVNFSGAIGELKVEAAASIVNGRRISFQFDRAAFSFSFLPFKVPYPVPFRLLGDKAKGWLDTTYLSPTGNMRISRGNKGTTFVLQKQIDPRQNLFSAISRGKDVKQAAEELCITKHNNTSADTTFPSGKWRLVWSSQPKGSPLNQVLNSLQAFQINEDSRFIENMIELTPGIQVTSRGTILPTSNQQCEVTFNDVLLEIGLLKLPFKNRSKIRLHALYSDGKVCIIKGDNNCLSVHLRDGV